MALREDEGNAGWYNPATWAITDMFQEQVAPMLTNVGQTNTGDITTVAGLSNDGTNTTNDGTLSSNVSLFGQPLDSSATISLGGTAPSGTTDSQLSGGTATGSSTPSFDRAGAVSKINEKAAAANKIFKTLFDGIDKVLAEQTGFLSDNQSQVQQGLEASRQQEARTLRNQFAARGLTDSSYRARAVGDVNREADRLGQAETQAYQQQLAGLGREANVARIGAQTEQGSIAEQLSQIDQFTDQELVDLKNQLDQVIAKRQTDVAQTSTNKAELAGFDAQSRVPGLTQRIEAIAQSAFAPQVKEQLISGLIQNSGLNPDEQELLANRFLAPAA